MKKLPEKYKGPLIGLGMMFIMITSVPAIVLAQRLPEGADYISAWITTVGNIAPFAVPIALVSSIVLNLLLSRFLIENNQT